MRSWVVDGATVSYCSFVQAVQDVHVSTFGSVLKLPSAHALHSRSVVSVGGLLSKVPGAQIVRAVHSRSVAGVGAALSYSSAPQVVRDRHSLSSRYSVSEHST